MTEDAEKKIRAMQGLSPKELAERQAEGLRAMTHEEMVKAQGDGLRNSDEAIVWNNQEKKPA